jgi:protocatechuate 3,4-dioxygenase beta subunit
VSEIGGAFAALKTVMAKFAGRLVVKTDSPGVYTLVTKAPSPYPQHKGQPMWFGEVRLGKAYASFHLMPLYMNENLTAMISPALKKRMQGKSCFNFKGKPEPELLAELDTLTEAGLNAWDEKPWL